MRDRNAPQRAAIAKTPGLFIGKSSSNPGELRLVKATLTLNPHPSGLENTLDARFWR
jgi:hypothetical protein